MYRKFIIPLFLAFATPTVASAQGVDAEFCFILGDFGTAVMTDRQNNVPYNTLRLQIIETGYTESYPRELVDLFLTVLNEAYQIPIQATPAAKRTMVNEFSTYVRNSCFEAI